MLIFSRILASLAVPSTEGLFLYWQCARSDVFLLRILPRYIHRGVRRIYCTTVCTSTEDLYVGGGGGGRYAATDTQKGAGNSFGW